PKRRQAHQEVDRLPPLSGIPFSSLGELTILERLLTKRRVYQCMHRAPCRLGLQPHCIMISSNRRSVGIDGMNGSGLLFVSGATRTLAAFISILAVALHSILSTSVESAETTYDFASDPFVGFMPPRYFGNFQAQCWHSISFTASNAVLISWPSPSTG